MVRSVRNVYGYSLILYLFLFLFPASLAAQSTREDTRVTVKGTMTLSSLFKSIAKQTGYYFVLDNEIVDVTETVTLEFNKARLGDVLEYALYNRNITWYFLDKRIFLQKKVTPVLSPGDPGDAAMTAGIVRGNITGPGGIPLSGATIIIKSTSRGITAGNDGSFILYGVNKDAVLHISSLGFIPKDTVLSGATALNIELEEAVNSLDAAVVIGYGTSSRRLLTGAVNRVSAEQIAAQPVANPLNVLQGQVPGVLVTNTSGLPGAEVKLYIRGRNSIAAGYDPLFIIDGVPFGITPLNSIDELLGASGAISPFNSINPADIESIDILKDADATAIYGSRGANGVVLITTKKGKPGKSRLDVNVYTGAGRSAGSVQMLHTPQYLAIRREAFANDGITPTALEAPDLLLWDTTRNVNWQRMLTGGTANITNAQASVSGGNNYTTFLAGGSLYKEGTVLRAPLGYLRGGGHVNVQHHTKNEKLHLAFSASFTSDKNESIAKDLFSFYNLPPNYPLYDTAGDLFWGTAFDNPEGYLRQQANSKTNNLLGNAVVRYRLFPGLTLKTSIGYTDIRMQQVFTFPMSSQHPQDAPVSTTRVGENERRSYILEPQADYTLRLGKGNLTALVGGTWQQNTTNGAYAEGQGYADESLLGSLKAADTVIRRTNTHVMYRYISFFTRVNYTWKDKYIINASYRRDGSSRFGPGRQFGNFGAVGAAWIFSEEPFMKQVPFLSFGKLRGSYGITGNDQIPDYQYMSNYGGNGSYQGNITLRPLRIANIDYSWEENRKLEVALELGFLKDRIFFSVAGYRNRSGNQLVGYQLPGITGFTSYQANLPALVENKGLELDLNTKNIMRKDFTWSSAFNLTFFNNSLRAFPGLAASSYANTYVIGEPLNILRGYHFTGVDSQTGIAQFEDLNKDGTLSSGNDFVTIGKTDPVYYGGLSNDLSYKGIKLSFLMQFAKQQGRKVVNLPGDLKNEQIASLLRWQRPGDLTDVPRATATPGDPAYDMNGKIPQSNAVFVDASYLRLKNLSVSYNLPEQWIKRLHLQTCRIYVQGQNLLTFTSYPGVDPETQLAMSPLKVVTAGIQLKL